MRHPPTTFTAPDVLFATYLAGWIFTTLHYSIHFIHEHGWGTWLLGGNLWCLVQSMLWPFLLLWDIAP